MDMLINKNNGEIFFKAKKVWVKPSGKKKGYWRYDPRTKQREDEKKDYKKQIKEIDDEIESWENEIENENENIDELGINEAEKAERKIDGYLKEIKKLKVRKNKLEAESRNRTVKKDKVKRKDLDSLKKYKEKHSGSISSSGMRKLNKEIKRLESENNTKKRDKKIAELEDKYGEGSIKIHNNKSAEFTTEDGYKFIVSSNGEVKPKFNKEKPKDNDKTLKITNKEGKGIGK